MNIPQNKIQNTVKHTTPNLTDVPETMLWTLHNRANEAMRPDGVIDDQKCIEIYQSVDYDYERSFGKAEPSHGIRSQIFDTAIYTFIKKHSDAVIVNLGEGLETQRYRVASNILTEQTPWYSVDLPDAIAVRERFIKPDDNHHHIAKSALDTTWFHHVPYDKPVFISAQGLFMYFEESEVERLIRQMLDNFEQGELMFDVIPRWLSKKTLSAKGWQKTPYYTTPPMPWGVNRNEAMPAIQSCSENIKRIAEIPFDFPRGVWRWLAPVFKKLPVMKNMLPSIYKVSFNKH